MMPIDDALHQILAAVPALRESETLPLHKAVGRILATTQTANIDVPPADNSAMDGYALNSENLTADIRCLPVSQRVPAGAVAKPLKPGTCARIFTGASIPVRANCVVMQEHCTTEIRTDSNGDEQTWVTFPANVSPGNNIRARGQDIAKDSAIIAKGQRLQPQDLGLLASIGVAEVQVRRRLRVAVISTGDELAEPGQFAKPGQIYNSNRYLLAGLLQKMGIDMIDAGRVADNFDATQQALAAAAYRADCVISTGGVSVGEEDHVKAAVESLGKLELWRLALKPGKPLAFGHIGKTPFFGLPGNPVSVFVTFLLFVRPFLYAQQGSACPPSPTLMVPASFSREQPSVRQEYLRVRIERVANQGNTWSMITHPNQSSGVLSSTSWANAFAIVAPDTLVKEGDPVPVLLFDSLFI